MNVHVTQQKIESSIRISAAFSLRNKHEEIWFEIPSEFQSWLTDSGDPFLVALIFTAMQEKENINFTNKKISETLLRNIYEFQRAWVAWRPDRYQFIEIHADVERKERANQHQALCAFTGGIDGGFVLYDNLLNTKNKLPYPIKALLYVQGFHISLENNGATETIYGDIKRIGDELNIQSIKIRSNLRAYGDWHDTHAASIIACMLLFQNHFNTALLGSSHPYQYLRLPWGSNTVTDGLLSTDQLKIVNYGSGFTRIEKLERLMPWKSFHQHINVCTRQYEKNCGRCEKCIRTILGYKALNQPIPITFPSNGIGWWNILMLLAYKKQEIKDYRTLCKQAFSNPNVNRSPFLLLYFNTLLNQCLNKILAIFGKTDLHGHAQWRKLKRRVKPL